MNRLRFSRTPLAGLVIVDRTPFADSRGAFVRVFCADELREVGWCRPIAQINHSRTAKRGTLRGMHYQQPPHAEMKLVSCLRGSAWDVAIDLRAESPTFLQWHAEEISADNGRALLISEGFAHGFQALEDETELLYCHSMPYRPDAEAGVHPLEGSLGIAWPLPVRELSARDASLRRVDRSFIGVSL